jgi:hypothetical protein
LPAPRRFARAVWISNLKFSVLAGAAGSHTTRTGRASAALRPTSEVRCRSRIACCPPGALEPMGYSGISVGTGPIQLDASHSMRKWLELIT